MVTLRPRGLVQAVALLVLSSCAACPQSQAQVPLRTSAASLRGTAVDATGHPLAGAVVRVVSDPTAHAGHPWRYTLIGDALGKFSQEGLAPGAYLVMLFPGGSTSTLLRRIELKAGAAEQLDLRVSDLLASKLLPVRKALSTSTSREGRALTR